MKTFSLALVLVAALAAPAHGQDVEVGTGLICNTAAQIEEYVVAAGEAKSQMGNAPAREIIAAALAAVNAKHQDEPNACGAGSIAYMRGKTVKVIDTPSGPREIAEIIVVGAASSQGVRSLPPTKQFTMFKPKGEGI